MGHVIGVDLGGTAIKAGICDDKGEFYKTLEIPTGVESNSSLLIMQNIKQCIRDLIDHADGKKIDAIGVGVPGIAFDNGRISIFSNIRVFDNYPMGPEIEKELKIPVFVDNDANNAARGEFKFGAGIGKKNFVLITLGTGIGGGVFINSDIYSGTNGCAGEVGHMVIVPDGKQCGCGNFGCWEAYGSASAMIRRASCLIGRKVKTSLTRYYPDNITAKVITDEARAGDPIALRIFDETAYYIGLGTANIINILNPQLCIFGGGLSHAGKFLFDRVKFHAMLNAAPAAWEAVDIVAAKLGNKAGIFGAAALAFMKKS
ncbi:MAG: ROK family protein [Brevinematales bacterium]|jgi:glucokinase